MSPLITGSPKGLFTLSSTSPMGNPQGLTWVQILSMDKTAVCDREFITHCQEGGSSPVHTCFSARVERGRCWPLRARGHWTKISVQFGAGTQEVAGDKHLHHRANICTKLGSFVDFLFPQIQPQWLSFPMVLGLP